jgi:hypothetical protein
MAQITITIKDEHIPLFKAAANGLAGSQIVVSTSLFGDEITHSYPPQQEGETNVKFAERVIRAAIALLVKLWGKNQDRPRYEAAVKAVPPPTGTIPDDFFG